MQKMIVLLVLVFISFTSFAKIWRVNNNAGVVADFIDISVAVGSASVLSGDTIHLEPSATAYGNYFNLTKRLVFIGPGYFLNPADATLGGNSGLQVATLTAILSQFAISATGAGSKFIGLTMNTVTQVSASTSPLNITFEKVCWSASGISFYTSGSNLNSDRITFRKCFFYGSSRIATNGATPTVSNLTVENCIFYTSSYIDLGNSLVGSGNVIRNNTWYASSYLSNISNAYVANNIFGYNANNTFTNCTLKNNLFASAQPLPGTATGNQVSVNMTNVYVGGITGSVDSRAALKAGSPAIGAGVTIAGYTPDAGAFGGPDPYKLSGIPPIPSIYSLTVPTSIPTGTATMNVTFSSRNNN